MERIKHGMLKNFITTIINVVKLFFFTALNTCYGILHSAENRKNLYIPIICAFSIVAIVMSLKMSLTTVSLLYYSFVFLDVTFVFSILILILFHKLKEPESLPVYSKV